MTVPTLQQPPQTTPPPDSHVVADLAAAAAVIATYQASTAAVRAQLEGFIRALWVSLGSWRAAQMREFTGQALPTVQGAMAHMADLTSGYLAAFAGVHGHPRPPAPSRAPTIGRVRNGADPVEVYERPFHLTWRQLAELPHQPGAIEQAVKAGEDRAAQLALTDVQLAKTHTAQQSMEKDRRIVGYRRELEGAYSCGLCIVASTVRYHKEQLMPIHPACVVEGTPVSAAGVNAMTRRRYAGEIIAFTTSTGDELTVTANHPVLTDEGWVPAGLVREGDRVARGLGLQRVGRGRPDEQQRPAVVEDVWRSLPVASLVRVPVAAENFHGDGSDGEVDVVYVDRSLHPVVGTNGVQVASEVQLMTGDDARAEFESLRLLAALFPSGLASPGGSVRSGSLPRTLISGHLSGADQPGFGPTADFNPRIFQAAANNGPTNGVALAEFVLAGASRIGGHDLLARQRDAGPTAATRFDPPSVEFAGNGRLAYASSGRALLDRLTDQIEFDSVVKADRVNYSGHVYNLHTDEGWYSAGGLIVSNCDCQPVPLYSDEESAWQREADKRLAVSHQAVADRFGKSSAGARVIPGAKDGKGNPLLYKDVLITHTHHEIGPVLGVRGQPFSTGEDHQS